MHGGNIQIDTYWRLVDLVVFVFFGADVHFLDDFCPPCKGLTVSGFVPFCCRTMWRYQTNSIQTSVSLTVSRVQFFGVPIGSMYDIFTYIWLICMVNVGKCTIHGSYGVATCHLFLFWEGNKSMGRWFWALSTWGPCFRALSCGMKDVFCSMESV